MTSSPVLWYSLPTLDLSQTSVAVISYLGCVMIDPASLELLRCPTESSHIQPLKATRGSLLFMTYPCPYHIEASFDLGPSSYRPLSITVASEPHGSIRTKSSSSTIPLAHK